MAVPKRRTSASKRDKRRAHDALTAPHVMPARNVVSRPCATGRARTAARTAGARSSRPGKADPGGEQRAGRAMAPAGAVVVCLFPGQGSQRVGMGCDLAAEFVVARRTFEEADDRLGVALARLCFEGPEETLRLTANAQPAILTAKRRGLPRASRR